jgi:succinyl-CoA synthetase beta subunit
MREALECVSILGRLNNLNAMPMLLPFAPNDAVVLSEAEAKELLSSHGVRIPKSACANQPKMAAGIAVDIGFPVVLKGEGIAHKTESGAVVLNLMDAASVEHHARDMPCDNFLIEEMITGAVAEILVGVVLDPAHGYVLTLAAGGQLTEILDDKVSMLLPVDQAAIISALRSLKIWPLLNGYRGGDPVAIDAITQAVMAVQEFVTANHGRVSEVEINPLICTKTDAIAADALIKIGERL